MISTINSNSSRVDIVDSMTLSWTFLMFSIMLIVGSILSTLFRRLISSVQKLINQEKTVTKALANVFAFTLCFVGFQESSKDSSVAHYLIVMFTVVMARVWVSFLMSLMFNNESPANEFVVVKMPLRAFCAS